MSEWNVRLQFDEVQIPEPFNDTADALFARLDALAPVATFEPGRISLFVTMEASSPEAALRSARKAVGDATKEVGIRLRGIPVGIEMYTEEELDRLNETPNYPEVVGVAEVAALLGVSKQRVSELARSRTFPRPLYELAAGPIWVKPTIQAFVEKWERKPGRPRKVAAS
jgi:predicted DNA-binding transcriptional regulator AlpA